MRRPLVQMLLIGVVASLVLTPLTLVMDWFPVRASTDSDDIDLLYDVLLIVSVPIFVLVMTIAIYSVIKFRARPGDEGDGEPIHGNARLEAIWIAVPFILVSALSVYAWVVLDNMEEKKPDAITVHVRGSQFSWEFEYPQAEGPPVKSERLYLPEGRQVEFAVRSEDVIHSFWVPEFRIKQDAVPGITTNTRAIPNRPGSFEVVCAELCGLGHATMRQDVSVLPQDRFTAWMDTKRQQLAAAESAPGDVLTEGRRLYNENGCGGCHTLADARAAAATGPPLDGLAEVYDKRDPGLSLDEYVRESIVEPERFVVPGFRADGMPSNYGTQLSRREIETLVAYLAKASEGSTGTAADAAPTEASGSQ